MTLSELIKEIISEWGCRVDDGLPNPKNPQHLRELRDVLEVMGLSSIKNELIANLLEGDDFKNPALNKVISYKSVNGEDAEGKVGNLLRRPSEEDAHKQAVAALGGEGSDNYKKAMKDLGAEGQPEKKAEKEKEGDSEGGGEKGEPQTGKALDPSTPAGKKFTDQLSPTDPEYTGPDKSEDSVEGDKTADKGETKQLSAATIKSKQKQLEDARRRMDSGNHNDDTKQAFKVFDESMNKLLNAKTDEERVEALRVLSDNGFLKRNANGKKLYIDNLPLPSKQITGDSGDAFGSMINKLAEDNEIDIPLRDESSDRALADVSGKHNEAGVAYLLDPSEKNKNEYDNYKDQYESYGGDEEAAHKQNEAAVQAINEEIGRSFPGGKVKSATQVGGIGPEKLKNLGIDPKKDPTDVLIEIEMPDGTTKYMKVSMKVYADPSSITMKNSGMGDAGSHYLGSPEIDSQLKALREKHNYLEPGISPEEVNTRKRAFKEAYLTLFSEKMVELSSTPEGQEKLMEMWKEVHGCGNDVYTSVTNKTTGETKVHKPEHYCEPEIPFKVEYDGVKVVIRMGGEKDNSFLEIVCKTESGGSPKILFNHKKSKKK